jgi:hypothetical protein
MMAKKLKLKFQQAKSCLMMITTLKFELRLGSNFGSNLQFKFFFRQIKQLSVLKGVRTWKTKKNQVATWVQFWTQVATQPLYAIIKQLLASKVVW